MPTTLQTKFVPVSLDKVLSRQQQTMERKLPKKQQKKLRGTEVTFLVEYTEAVLFLDALDKAGNSTRESDSAVSQEFS